MKGMCPSRACTLHYRTHSGYSEPQNSLCKWPQSLHRSLPQVCLPWANCVVYMHTLGPQQEPRGGCLWGVWTEFGCEAWVSPSTITLPAVCGNETGVGRERRWAVGPFFLCLHVLEYSPDPKFKLGFPGRYICEGRKGKHI